MNNGSSKPNVLVCWRSEGKGEEVLVNSLKSLRNRGIHIDEVIYLLQQKTDDSKISLPPAVSVHRIKIPVNDPTQHAELYALVKDQVVPQLQKRENANIHVNASPGTPAMHAVWLILHAGGWLPEGTKLWSSQRDPETKRTRIDRVQFPISTYLLEVHRAALATPELAQYEPEAKSSARRQAMAKLGCYARVAGAPLLILGERGTGKTRLVETVVRRLKGRDRVISVPCGGLDSALAESFIFGHRKGAFTGAEADRAGALKAADRGILFLDEVQDLPQTAQRKLVQVFQDYRRRFRPLGSDREETADVELVCASNLNPSALRRKLDPDFFDRLSHLMVTLPPLRDCREDLCSDWSGVWSELRRDNALPKVAPWSDDLWAALEKHSLPGNLRDLQRLAYLVMAWSTPNLTANSIETALRDWREHPEFTEETGVLNLGTGNRSRRLRWFRRELAAWAKQQFGTWSAAAKHLECNEKTLRDDWSESHGL